jgi:hypothetical protein
MGSIFGDKPRRKRTRKTTEEKLRDLAEKEALRLAKTDDTVLRLLIKKYIGIDVPPASERSINQVIDNIKLRAYQKVENYVIDDPVLQEELLDKIIDDLLGRPSYPSKAKGTGSHTQRPSFQSQLDNIERTIDRFNQIKKTFGLKENNWSEILKNPEFIRVGLELIKGLAGAFGLIPHDGAANNNKVFVGINGKLTEMSYEDYIKYLSKQTGTVAPAVNPAITSGEDPKDMSANPINSPNSTVPSANHSVSSPSELTNSQSKSDDTLLYCSLEVMSAMDKPPEEVAKRVSESSKAGDQKALILREFLLTHNYDEFLKIIRPHIPDAKLYAGKQEWYSQVVKFLNAQALRYK